ncbi:hypothetical protein ISCGN_001594 [Ixodes scapularis]
MGHRKPRNTRKKFMLGTGATVKDLIGEIRDTFYPDETQTMAQQIPTAETRLDREVQTAQESEEIKGIDSDFTDAELQTALFQMKRNTAPGPDKITYGMLRNILDNKLDELLRHINEVWATGELPEEWKEAHVIMLPKPGKLPNTPANLRPISKTSCMGKLMEKMALNRLEWHLEVTNQLVHTLVGIRKHVSTQDVAKMIKEQVYDNPSTVQQRTIVAVDLKRAFDNVTHEAILRNLRETNPGNRMYRYVKNFLKDRTLRSGRTHSEEPTVFFSTSFYGVISGASILGANVFVFVVFETSSSGRRRLDQLRTSAGPSALSEQLYALHSKKKGSATCSLKGANALTQPLIT